MNDEQSTILADILLKRLGKTEIGHCARIDYIGRDEARAVCRRLATADPDLQLAAHILVTSAIATDVDPLCIATDQAIELRNRKQKRICLFIPTDVVDAAFSSLANSFELIDGRTLHETLLRELRARLTPKAQEICQKVFAQLRRPLQVGVDQQLDFVEAISDLSEKGAISEAGLALWRVGLIADARDDFARRLDQNRDCTKKLARPGRIQADLSERINVLGVDSKTATALAGFFRSRALHDSRAWSRDIAEGKGLTFDQWLFPQKEPSNIRSVTVRPFVGSDGSVERNCRLSQPDGPGGSLHAMCGPRESMMVRWVTDPPTPVNLKRWRVEMTSSGGESLDELDFELPVMDVAGSRRSCTIKLDLDFDESPDFGLCIQVSALDAAGNVLENEETGEPIRAPSDEFFLKKGEESSGVGPRQSRRTVPTIAFGRLEAAVDAHDEAFQEAHPQWLSQGGDYFSLRLNDRRLLNIGLSSVLIDLERKVIADPRGGGCFTLDLSELQPIQADQFQHYPLFTPVTETWASFWKAREAFLSRLVKADPRDVMEAADWTPELGSVAIRYAQAYRELLEDLVGAEAEPTVLKAALSVDTALIRLSKDGGLAEEALLVLPTHPLRAAWIAGYTQLLRHWETQLLKQPVGQRKSLVDLDLVRQLAPINVPTFAFHPAASSPFVFFQNLLFFCGVALPPEIPDPDRRLADIVMMLGVQEKDNNANSEEPAQLTAYLRRFRETHPFVQALVLTLVNTDDGELIVKAVGQLFPSPGDSDDEVQPADAPTAFQINAYVEDRRNGSLRALEAIRRVQTDLALTGHTDQLLPGLATTLHDLSTLEDQPLLDTHLTIISDFTRPRVVTVSEKDEGLGESSGLPLHGLIARLTSRFSAGDDNLRWLHQVPVAGRAEAHPAGPRYSDTLQELHDALQRAGTHALGGASSRESIALEVALPVDRQRLLEQIHEHSDWVITRDKFFALDYYDSPHDPYLTKVARKYLLDYAPEFTEGLGRRMMLTTSSRDEINGLLSRAMGELGFAVVDQSVRQLLHYLKTVTGHLALQALGSANGAASAVGLGVVTAWLQGRGRLRQGVLVPVDPHPRLFSRAGNAQGMRGDRRCDLVLFGLKRNIVEATFIEVKWRRGQIPIGELAADMQIQMEATAQTVRDRCFNESRVDGSLQRAVLTNVLRFYFDRARRYKLLDSDAEVSFAENLARLERTRTEFRPSYEGYIVSLEDEPRRPFPIGEAKYTVLTARDFESSTEFQAQAGSVPIEQHQQKGLADTDRGHTQLSSADTAGSRPSAGQEITGSAKIAPQTTVPNTETLGRATGETNHATKPRAAVIGAGSHDPSQEGVPHPGQSVVETDEVRVSLGEAAGTRVDWSPSIKGSPHLFILGIPGQGKSWTVQRILSQLSSQSVPSLVIDFHGQFSDPQSSLIRSTGLTVLDAAAGLPFSPFECSRRRGPNDWRDTAYAVAEIFAYIAGLGDMQRDVVYTSIRDAYRVRGFDRDPDSQVSYPAPDEILGAIIEQERQRHVPNVSARLRPLLEMGLFQPEADTPDMLSLIRSGLVVDMHNLSIETAQLAVGAFVLRKLYKDMFTWGVADRLRLAVVLDEAHRLARDVTLPKIMKEGRKFGIAVVVASQGLGDFHHDVLSNAGTKVVFRMNYPESRRIAGFIRSRQHQDLAGGIEQLPVGAAYVQTPEMPFGSVVKMYPLD